MSKVIVHADGLVRCPWPKEDPLYVAYHDDEWGVPEFDDRALFEKLVLDGFQAGLSWITILRKRDNFRRAFNDFEPEKIARYPKRKIESLMKDAGIVRNRAKIEGAVSSARAWLKIMENGPASLIFCGTTSTASHNKTNSARPSRCRRKLHCRKKYRRNWLDRVSNSSAPPSSTHSCKPSGWSTIIS
jgi:DNA-3-methyladenine glycosylase I